MTTKPIKHFRVGDVVKRKDNKQGLYVVAGTKGWVHKPFTLEDGSKSKWISLTKEIGVVSLLTHEDEYKLVTPREKVGKKWWIIFPKGEK
ncbi:TPA: hypothetical protein DIU22_05105 [Candidatus Woesebacteria bacterium]|nr:hypothetical protein [Candidatus Woesebacteria bacterium]